MAIGYDQPFLPIRMKSSEQSTMMTQAAYQSAIMKMINHDINYALP